eukprot:scaffold1178_cov252-Pinguiococcus_pyrenoidosus.AAC.2
MRPQLDAALGAARYKALARRRMILGDSVYGGNGRRSCVSRSVPAGQPDVLWGIVTVPAPGQSKKRGGPASIDL